VVRDRDRLLLANHSKYGLGANLYTHDPVKAKRFFEEVEAGTLWINDPLTDNDAGLFGGFKMSGMGRELSEEGLDEFRETKHVHWGFEGRLNPGGIHTGRKKIVIRNTSTTIGGGTLLLFAFDLFQRIL
jgi:Aldehyde dehydrogenase family